MEVLKVLHLQHILKLFHLSSFHGQSRKVLLTIQSGAISSKLILIQLYKCVLLPHEKSQNVK